MSLKVEKEQPVHAKAMIAAERMMFTADKSELVPNDDQRAASLAVPYGRRIHPDMVKRFGIVDGKMAKPEAEDEKAAQPASNKRGKKAHNKGK